MKKINPKKCFVFFDFDNTIATTDTLDSMLPLFSTSKRWIELEEKWQKGKIGSRECLEGQMTGMRLSKIDLDNYITGIKLDPYFKKILSLLKGKKVKVAVLSDNFDYLLKRILRHHGVRDLRVYCNKLAFSNGRFSPSFPYTHKNCHVCAHCKTKNLLAKADRNHIIYYIGDGRSDICPAKYADIIFAKKDLLAYCKTTKLPHLPFKTLKKVYHYFKRSLQ